jgi:hypothetical protein
MILCSQQTGQCISGYCVVGITGGHVCAYGISGEEEYEGEVAIKGV